MRQSKQILGGFLLAWILLTPLAIATDTVKPAIVTLSAQTLENQGIYGDSIRIFYSESMLIEASPYPLAGGMEDVNNVPGSEKKAPAEYPQNKGNATAKNTAKNYIVNIIPEQGSSTSPYQGTWAGLGGTAIYDPYDPNRQTVLLLPPNKDTNLFAPGDKIEITVVITVVDPAGNSMDANKNKATQKAS